jgi:hypothetical protein
MRLEQVPILNDYPEHRGCFIKSTTTGGICFLTDEGKMLLINEKVQRAIERLFDELKRPECPQVDPTREDISIVKFVTLARMVKGLFVPVANP